MPPVREPSTKPSAATVLPAPSRARTRSAWPRSGPPAPRAAGRRRPRRRCRRPSSPVAPPARRRPRAPPRPGSPTEASGATSGSGLPLDAPPLPDSASSAVSVPESASTWWAERTVPSARCGSSWQSSRSSPSRSDQRWRQPTEGALAPASSSASAASSASRRAVPTASWAAASSPSSTNGSRVNAAARLIASSEGWSARPRRPLKWNRPYGSVQ